MILFGTDGIRKKFGEFPLTTEEIRKIGYSVASILFQNKSGIVYISNDGRESANQIETALNDGINKQGSKAISLGMLHTPALSAIVNNLADNFSIGIQITASHNPYYDNGIKIFDYNGNKLNHKLENKIEDFYKTVSDIDTSKKNIQILNNKTIIKDKYIKLVRDYFTRKVTNIITDKNKSMRVLIDCANGATSKITEEIFKDTCLEVITIFDQPNGKNINYNCGSTHPEFIRNYMKQFNLNNKIKINLGVAFDGDGDRAIFISQNGKILDGDEILLIISEYKKRFENYQESVIGTHMTNFGIHSEYKKSGINFIKTNVGDRNVLEGMIENNAQIGGESSGHIIVRDFIDIPIGDSILTLINVLKILYVSNNSLDDLTKHIKKIPSKLINIPIKNKLEFMRNEHNKKITNNLETKVMNHGRILLRPSGTENLIRLLIEYENEEEINSLVDYFCDNIIRT